MPLDLGVPKSESVQIKGRLLAGVQAAPWVLSHASVVQQLQPETNTGWWTDAVPRDRDILLHGAYTAQDALKAGVLDIIELQLRPVLLGQARLLFDRLPAEHIELNLVRALDD